MCVLLWVNSKYIRTYPNFLLFLIHVFYFWLTPTRVLRVQSQVDEVIDVMQENISKVIERGERLDDLQDKSGESHQDSKPTGNVLSSLCFSI